MNQPSRLAIARIIVKNDRVHDYEQTLRLALEHGYKVGGILDFLRADPGERWLVLRHDVDVPAIGVREMLDIESCLGVHSTWYFRWATFDDELIHTVLSKCGEVGLHYETLATILMRHGAESQDKVTPPMIEEAQRELSREVASFRERLGLHEITIASHGHALNQQVRMSNNVLATDEFCRDNGIAAEAYAPRILGRIACYISDTNLLTNAGWAYQTTAIDAIRSRHQTICFLTHPNHWRYTRGAALIDLAKLAIRGVRYQNRRFRAYYET